MINIKIYNWPNRSFEKILFIADIPFEDENLEVEQFEYIECRTLTGRDFIYYILKIHLYLFSN